MSGDSADKSARAAPQIDVRAGGAALHLVGLGRNYHDLRRIVDEWCAKIRMTRAELDAKAGLTDGHSAKLLSRRQIKRMGPDTLGPVLTAAGLVFAIVIDPDTQACPQAADGPAPRQHWRHNKGSSWGRRMAALRRLKLTAERRREIARKAAQARWQQRLDKSLPAELPKSAQSHED
jgi:hypothetical protein